MTESLKPRERLIFMVALVVAGEAIFGLPFLITRFFRPTVLDVFGLTNLELGWATSVYGLVAMASYFLGGPLADRFSARHLLAASLLVTALGGVVFASIPTLQVLGVLYGFWGFSTIMLFWAALIRATREWGGADQQGRAFGLLDGGRGVFAAVLASVTVGVLASLLPEDAASASLAERSRALSGVIWVFTAMTALAALLVWFGVPAGAGRGVGEGDTSERFSWPGTVRVLGMPRVWLQAVIVICAYVSYKGADDFALMARDVYGMDDVESGTLVAFSSWIRPVAALGAGLLGDRLGSSRVVALCFGSLVLLQGVIGFGVLPPTQPVLFIAVVAATTVFFQGLRGLYFALLEEGAVPKAYTGTAVGLVSVIGYTPDVFMGVLMGFLTDRSPGAAGHQDFFAVLALFSLVGCAASVAFLKSLAAPGPARA